MDSTRFSTGGLGRAILGTGSLVLVAQLVGITFTLVGAKLFEQELFGVLVISIGMLMLGGTIVGMGLPGTMPHFVTVAVVRGDLQFMSSIVFSSSVIVTVVGVVVAGSLYFYAEPIAQYVYGKPEAAPFFSAAALGVPFIALAKVLTGGLRGVGRTVVATFVELVLWRAQHLVALAGAAILGYGIVGVMVGVSGSGILMALVAFVLVYVGIFRDQSIQLYFDRHIASYAVNSWITSVLILARNRGNVVLFGVILSSADIAAFSVGATIASVLLLLVNIIGPAYRPLATSLLVKGDKDKLLAIHNRIVEWSVVTVVPIGVFLLFFGGDMVDDLIGSDYERADIVIKTLVLGIIPRATLGPVNATLLSLGHAGKVRKIETVSTIVFLLLLILLVPTLGLLGAAATITATGIIEQCLKVAAVREEIAIRWFPSVRALSFCFGMIVIGGLWRVNYGFGVELSGDWIYSLITLFVFGAILALLSKLITITEVQNLIDRLRHDH